MRVAVALPNLPATSPQRLALEATLDELRALGVDLEAFAEEPRDYTHLECEVFHYLRMPERHRRSAFDTGLYPLGRDWRPYEAAFLLMDRFPGLVWALDPVLHHLLIGGAAMRGRWDDYRRDMERGFGAELGAGLTTTVAWGWAVRSTYRRYDPMPARLRAQRGVCAATPAIAAAFERLGTPAPVVPLALAHPQQPAKRSEARCRRVLLLTFHYGWPEPVLAALARLLESSPGLDLRVVVPELVHQVAIGPRANALGIADSITWVFPDEATLELEARSADLIVHLRDDPTAGERALIDAGLMRGIPAMVLRVPQAHDLPEDAAVRVEPGRSLNASFAGLIETLAGDEALYRGICEAARRYGMTRPGPADSARRLVARLEAAGATGLVEHPASVAAWSRLRREMRDAAIPNGASPELGEQIESVLEDAVPEALRHRHVPR